MSRTARRETQYCKAVHKANNFPEFQMLSGVMGKIRMHLAAGGELVNKGKNFPVQIRKTSSIFTFNILIKLILSTI
jgi:hypothetical protein